MLLVEDSNTRLKKVMTFWVLCPFHSEKTPSFTVSDDKGFLSLFWVCSAHGDVISLCIMQNESVDFKEALKILSC